MVVLVLAVAFMTAAAPVLAQMTEVPPQGSTAAVEESFNERGAPRPEELPEIVIQEETGRTLKGGEGVTFHLEAIRFEGNRIYTDEKLERQLWEYIDGIVEVSALQMLANDITRFYKEQGYFLTRAYLPPQTIKDGEILIKVREGRLGEIIIRGNKRYSRDLIRNTLKIVRGEGAVRTTDVERGLLLLTDIPGLNVKATFKPGEKPGTSDIVLDVSEEYPVHASLDFNNFGSEFVSRERYGATGSVYNLTGLGDSFTLRFVTGNGFIDEMYYIRGEWVQPLGYSGTRLGLYYQHLYYELGAEAEILDFSSRTNAGGLYVKHPFIRGRYLNWYVSGGFELKNVKNEIATYNNVGEDKIRAANVGTSLQWVDVFGGANNVGLRGYQYFSGVFGGMDEAHNDTVRIPTEVVSSKFEVDASRIQDLWGHASLILAGRGQWSPDRLASSEMIAVGGSSTVRGFEQGEYTGDSGYYLTAEAQVPIPGTRNIRWYDTGKTVFDTLALAAFYDYGFVSINDKLRAERLIDDTEISGLGVGLRFNYDPYVKLRVDWAKSVGETEPRDESVEQNGIWYIQCQVSY